MEKLRRGSLWQRMKSWRRDGRAAVIAGKPRKTNNEIPTKISDDICIHHWEFGHGTQGSAPAQSVLGKDGVQDWEGWNP